MGLVMFQTIITSKKKSKILENFKKNIVKHFGPGSIYFKNLNERRKYKRKNGLNRSKEIGYIKIHLWLSKKLKAKKGLRVV